MRFSQVASKKKGISIDRGAWSGGNLHGAVNHCANNASTSACSASGTTLTAFTDSKCPLVETMATMVPSMRFTFSRFISRIGTMSGAQLRKMLRRLNRNGFDRSAALNNSISSGENFGTGLSASRCSIERVSIFGYVAQAPSPRIKANATASLK